MSTDAQSDAAWKSLGVMLQPGTGTAYPELKKQLQNLYSDRVAGIPWLPQGWMLDVARLQQANPGDLVVLAPSNGKLGMANTLAPDWQNADQRKIWTDINATVRAAIVKYAANDAAAGATELAILRAKADFWDFAYRAAVEVRDAVPNAVGAIASNLWEGLGGKWKVILFLGIAGFAAYKLGWLKKGALVAVKQLKAK